MFQAIDFTFEELEAYRFTLTLTQNLPSVQPTIGVLQVLQNSFLLFYLIDVMLFLLVVQKICDL